METSKTASSGLRQALQIALLTSSVLLAYEVYYWDLMDFFTPFLILIPTFTVWVIFILVSSGLLVYTGFHGRRLGSWGFFPLIIQLVALVLALAVPWTSLILEWDFSTNLAQREDVIKQALAGQYKIKYPGSSDSIMILPRWYRSLSKGGEIMVSEKRDAVFFYTVRGVMDNFAGFIYRADDADPQEEDFGGQIIVLEKMRDHWFWAQFH